MTKQPLFKGSKLDIYNPTIDFFIQKIEKKEYISIVRFQIEYWNMIRSAMRLMGYPGNSIPPNIKIDNNFLDSLSKNMVAAFNSDNSVNHRRPWKFSAEVFRQHLKMITNTKPPGLFLGVADRAIYMRDTGPDVGNNWQSDLIKMLLPKDEVPFLSTVWRKWAYTGEIKKFIDVIKNKQIVVIGPFYYKELAKKAGFKKAEFIEIDLRKACLQVSKTRDQVRKIHDRLIQNNEEIIYIIAGGSAGAAIIYQLHGQLKNAHMFELGRALDVYFYYDQVKKQQPKWVFGEWMDKFQPKWLKK